MSTNLTTFFQDSTLRAAREPEVPLASFENGMNPAASCAPGVGINTGDYGPKESDWPHIKGLGESQQILNVIPHHECRHGCVERVIRCSSHASQGWR